MQLIMSWGLNVTQVHSEDRGQHPINQRQLLGLMTSNETIDRVGQRPLRQEILP